LTAFETEYGAIVARAGEIITGFGPHLRALAGPWRPQWAESTFSRVVSLLPFWVEDLLVEDQPAAGSPLALEPTEIKTLSLACLLGWWSYLLQDELLDRDLACVDLLPLSTALHVAAVHLLQRLLPEHQSFWDAFEALSLAMAEANAWEQCLDLAVLAKLESQGLAPEPEQLDDLERLADRAALLQLPVIGVLALRDQSPAHPPSHSLAEMVRHFAIARQIGDDRADCLGDLRKGRLNHVSASMVRRMWQANVVQSYAELDADWLAGRFLYDDELFADIHQVALGACHAAAQSLAPFQARLLRGLIDQQARQLQQGYEAALVTRQKVRSMLFPSV
jgi:hypothetical protein